MTNTRKFLALFLAGTFFITSCSDDDEGDNPDPVNEEEVITTMTVTLTGGGDTVTLNFFDPDGENGPIAPVKSVEGDLKVNTTYNGTIQLLNASEEEVEDVNDEIKAEADEHQFFYLTDDLGITITYDDKESDFENSQGMQFESDNPVGIDFTLTTTDQIGDAELEIILLHELDKNAEGVAGGNTDNAGGEPDIEVTFNITVE
ncbi:type 1 periplasmic binding fold superfamily protein [Aquimarina sp. ERC-38]|uniref:type 1 periplasmic binding fold superfamily protein n=1 Tax=Aquimarina sp. ERC-38 TaxID=2949996 RepID=UPI0022478BAA|nr:type 1 periplasmic binding fold superfamily protein [Aquimarina sp. ERC-38]UZO81774.1 type 1 periplasmic binding fold superfamily protein [Aquimarina sp. ERC-38]